MENKNIAGIAVVLVILAGLLFAYHFYAPKPEMLSMSLTATSTPATTTISLAPKADQDTPYTPAQIAQIKQWVAQAEQLAAESDIAGLQARYDQKNCIAGNDKKTCTGIFIGGTPTTSPTAIFYPDYLCGAKTK